MMASATSISWRQRLYREALRETVDYMEGRRVIDAFRRSIPLRPRREIPV